MLGKCFTSGLLSSRNLSVMVDPVLGSRSTDLRLSWSVCQEGTPVYVL